MLTACPLFALIPARLRGIGGRSRRVEQKLDALLDLNRRMETTMADNDSALLAKLNDLEAKVNAYTTDQGNKIAAAVAAARAAQKQEDQASAAAEMEAALAKIDDIGKGLVTFTPSGN
jgi:hypothetical protein